MSDLYERVLGFIDDGGQDDFAALALAVFAHQYEGLPAYRRLCDRRGRTPANVSDWREVPPIQALAFKSAALHIGPPERVFLSTGTTRGAERRSRHAMPEPRLYHRAAVHGLRRFVFPDAERMRILSLIGPAAERPESSLAQMVAWAMEEFGTAESRYVTARGHLDMAALIAGLRRSEADGEPVCVMTTTAAWHQFLDHCRSEKLAFRLPHSSRLMDTGGDKGTSRPLSRNGLLRATWDACAIPGYFAVNEYGMTELSSQFYDDVIANRVRGRFAPRAKVGPHWVRTRILDPITLAEVPDGATGLLCHFDLANAATAACVLTEDIGRSSGDGFEILGRAAGAEARGCSLAQLDAP